MAVGAAEPLVQPGREPATARPEQPAKPQSRTLRNIGVDVARGVALVGMIANHTFPYTVGDKDYAPQTYAQMIAGGRASAAFALLAGVGIALLSGGTRPVTGRALWGIRAGLLARGLLLIVIGLALGQTGTELNVILAYFGMYFIFAIPLVGMRPKALFATAAGVAIAVPIVLHLVADGLPSPDYDSPTFGTLVGDPLGLFSALSFTGIYPALPWMTMIAAGIAAGRLDLSSARVAGKLLVGGLALAGTAWLASSVLLYPLGGLHTLLDAGPRHAMVAGDVIDIAERGGDGIPPSWSWWWLAVRAPHTAAPLDLLHVTGVALALLGGMLLLTRAAVVARVLKPLALAGAMTLTIYSCHVLLFATDIPAAHHLTLLLLAQLTVGIVFAVLWRRRFARGPLESVLHTAALRARRAVTQYQGPQRRSVPEPEHARP